MNNKETQISNMSYTNKDFNSIYSELLDTAKDLTNKWDPSQSNESDPGVVLIKENAIVGDKNNYNIDKNVLELFPLSVTQVGNARKIYDFAGYQMHWYNAASADISVKYTTALDSNITFSIPLWYAFTNDDGSIVYTHVPSDIDEVSTGKNLITSSDRTADVHCLQGVIQTYDINGETLIRFNNLDSQRRLFFTYTNVAENGIFIKVPDGEWWKKVDNLESYAPNSLIYKFGVLPNTNTCYIQFPDDIQYIIGEGIEIKYLTTLGESGNVNANAINSVYSDDKIIASDGSEITLVDNVKITNINGTSDGADPEDLDSAYENYKKVVGTFDTLVTCRDYENALYRSGEVSNCVVSDRTNDLYGTYNVMRMSGMGSKATTDVAKHSENLVWESGSPVSVAKNSVITNIAENDGQYTVTVDEIALTAYDIVLRLLQPVSSITDSTSYNKTFTKIEDDESIIGNMVTQEYKSCQHDFVNPTDVVDPGMSVASTDLPYIFKNYYTVRGTLLTYTKVGTEEIKEIEANARKALFNRFNAHEVNFGESILYEDIVKTLQESDSRIKGVTLNDDLSYVLRKLTVNDTDGERKDSVVDADLKINALAKMVLKGNVPLYDFNKDCTLQYGETSAIVYPTASTQEIRSITTTTEIAGSQNPSTDNYEFTVDDENKNIVLFTPNYIDSKIYTYYTKVTNNTGVNIQFDVDTKLEGAGLLCEWKDENGIQHSKTIPAGTIVKLSGYDVVTGDKDIINGVKCFKATGNNSLHGQIDLQSTGKVSVREKNEKPLASEDGNNFRFIFFTNDYTYDGSKYTFTLFDANDTERILGVDEYFMYTNSTFDELVILGSGTKISRDENDKGRAVSYSTKMDLTEILDDGMQAVNELDWQLLPYTLTATELMIVTLGKGSKLIVDGAWTYEDLTSDIDNPVNFGHLKLTYIDSNDVEGTMQSLTDDDVKGVSRLNLRLSQTLAQTLTSDDHVILNYNGGTAEDLSGCSIKANRPTAITGGKNISALVTYISETAGIKNEYTLNIVKFTESEITPTPDAPSSVIVSDGDGGYTINTHGKEESTYVKLPLSKSYWSWIKVELVGDSDSDVFTQVSNSSSITLRYNVNGVDSIKVLGVKSDNTSEYVSYTYENNTVTISDPTDYSKYVVSYKTTYQSIDPAQSINPESLIKNKVETIPIKADYIEFMVPPASILYINKLYITSDKGITSSNSDLSREVKGTLDALATTTYDSYDKLSTILYDGWTNSSVDPPVELKGLIPEYGFDELYQVLDIDRIDLSLLVEDSNGNYDIFQPAAIWDTNHIWNRFTIPQLDTRSSTIQVSRASRK